MGDIKKLTDLDLKMIEIYQEIIDGTDEEILAVANHDATINIDDLDPAVIREKLAARIEWIKQGKHAKTALTTNE